MNRMRRERCIASEAPASRRLMPQAHGWTWRRQVATALLLAYGFLPLLPAQALAEPPPLPGRPPFAVASLQVTSQPSDLPLTRPSPRALLTEPAAQEAPLTSDRLASLPRQGNTPNLLPPSILPPPAGATAPSHVTALGRLPLAFIENKGQVDERARFYVRSGGQTVWLTSEGLRFDLLRAKGGAATRPETPSLEPRHPTPAAQPQPPDRERLVFAQDFVGATKRPTIEASHPLPGIYNFFKGQDPAKWRTGVKGYATLTYRDVWDGIDLKLYGNGRALEQEFIVKPGGELSRIKVAYRGITGLTVAQDGSLLIKTAFGELKESPPRIYQQIDGKRVEVAGRFKLLGATAYTFEVGPYHPQYALVIDPTLVYSTFLGGSNNDEGRGIAVDAAGNAYVTGVTYSSNFPATLGILDTSIGGSRDAFVTKLNPTGSGLLYSTFLGGSNSDDGNRIAVDALGNAYVTGLTYSSDFPTTPGAYDTSFNGVSDAFVTKLNPTGSALVFSTFLGGSNGEHLVQSHFPGEFGDNIVLSAVALDALGNVYVAGITFSSDFPTTPGAFDTSFNGWADTFVTKLDSTGSRLVFSTFLGGSDLEEGVRDMAVDASGNAYVTSNTYSSDFPTTPGAFDRSFAGGLNDPFVTKLSSIGELVYSTFLGGTCWESGAGIAVDDSGNAYVTGSTCSSDFPTTPGAFDTSLDSYDAAFVTKLNPTGSALVYSTFLGGSGGDFGYGIAVDTSGNAFVTGYTASSDFPTTPGAFDTSYNGGGDAFVTEINPIGSSLIYSTFLGGSGTENLIFLPPYQPHPDSRIALDTLGNIYITGSTYSTDFATTPGAFQSTYAGGGDAFVARFAFGTLTLSASAILPGTGGDTGLVSVIILGGGYVNGATVKLVKAGQPDIVGDPVTVGAGGVSIATTFDLTGKARGLWDVVVANPDGASATLLGGFTIEEGRAPQLWVDIVGRDTIRVGREQTYIIRYGNRGNVDALLVPLWIGGIPPDATWKLSFEVTPASTEGLEDIDWAGIPISINRPNETVLPFFVSRVPAGFTGVLKFSITIASAEGFSLSTWISPPMLGADSSFSRPQASAVANALSRQSTSDDDCLVALELLLLDLIGLLPFVPSTGCVVQMASNFTGQIASWVNATNHPTIWSGIQVAVATFAGALQSAPACLAELNPTVALIAGIVQTVFDSLNAVRDCRERRPLNVTPVASFDPNDKVGSRGAGVPQYLSGEVPLPYLIFFENVETATAPAQEVVVTDQLDMTKMDLSTVSFGPIAFGDKEVTPPAGLSEFTTDVDLRPAKNLLVRINVRLDPATGLLTWRLTSIDPATGQLPEDPMAGFLPPNRTAPEGDGSVLFTVRPKPGLPTGTEVRNRASIVFDLNPPIDTPEWLNTLDNSKPESQVLPLSASQPSATFPIQWAGTDEGSGIRDYTVFVSEDGGPFAVWLVNTPDTGGSFTGQLGRRYAFYSIARDASGNLEEPPSLLDATTFIPATLPDLTGAWGSASQSCRRGRCKLRGSVRVVNQGTATAPSSRLRVLLSDDAVLDPGDAVLQESSIKKLRPGRGKTSKVKVTLPLGVNAAGKYLFAVIDALNSVAESDETNNAPMAGPIP